jgi:GNAT superfamily N-acetyltransferase
MKDVRKIKIEDTYALRHQILRPHQTIDQCRYPGDFDELTAHLGIFEADELVGILSIYKVQNNEIEIPDSWQLRAMATSTGARGKGYGFKLLNAAEVYASQHQALCIWANNNKWTVIVREEALVSCSHFRRMIEQGCYSV